MKIQIICSSPGIRRNGIAHPASAFYDEARWDEKQLAAFEADPAFTVRTVDDAMENVKTDTDFELAVAAEVTRQMTAKATELQASFNQAVEDAVTEKTAAIKADADKAVEDLGTKLKAANDKLAAQATATSAEKKGAAAKK
ncbi:hypothetical protein [Hoeflea sp.]|uniref:hypothetical protein n=1 Tax=Hoeflea sp. TaxID=1940281 RepID=UPI003A9290D8